VAAAALGAAAMRLFNREERKEMKTTRDEAVAKATELEAVWKSIEQTQLRRQYRGAPEIWFPRRLEARVQKVESDFFEADAQFEARTDALKKEYETTLKVRTDVLEQELRREKESAIRSLEEAQKLQLEEMRGYFAEETAEMKVAREKAEREKQIARQRAAEAAAKAEAERAARAKRMF